MLKGWTAESRRFTAGRPPDVGNGEGQIKAKRLFLLLTGQIETPQICEHPLRLGSRVEEGLDCSANQHTGEKQILLFFGLGL